MWYLQFEWTELECMELVYMRADVSLNAVFLFNKCFSINHVYLKHNAFLCLGAAAHVLMERLNTQTNISDVQF